MGTASTMNCYPIKPELRSGFDFQYPLNHMSIGLQDQVFRVLGFGPRFYARTKLSHYVLVLFYYAFKNKSMIYISHICMSACCNRRFTLIVIQLILNH
jgi:hypothetical protein